MKLSIQDRHYRAITAALISVHYGIITGEGAQE
jgi:hypothetical protein